MIYRIICILLVSVLAVNLKRPPEQKTSVSYEIIDEIVSEREKIKKLEDLISDIEAGNETEIRFTDASGTYGFNTYSSEQLLDYLYSERDRIRANIDEIMRT